MLAPLYRHAAFHPAELQVTAHDINADDRRPLNWSAVRGSNTDFNNNSRGVQGGCGFASDVFAPPGTCTTSGATTPANPNIYDHGIAHGGSDALDAQTLWIFAAVRPLKQPQPSNTAALASGLTVFATHCATCHGGPKWTKSQIFYRDNPAFNQDPAAGGVPLDPGITNAGAQIQSFTLSGLTFMYLENVSTFDATDPLEQRGQGALSGQLALGGLGFNVPSLLGWAITPRTCTTAKLRHSTPSSRCTRWAPGRLRRR